MATGPQTSEHIDEDILELYALGRLPTGLSARTGRHLHSCATCGRRLWRTREFVTAIIGALSSTESHKPLVAMRRKGDS